MVDCKVKCRITNFPVTYSRRDLLDLILKAFGCGLPIKNFTGILINPLLNFFDKLTAQFSDISSLFYKSPNHSVDAFVRPAFP